MSDGVFAAPLAVSLPENADIEEGIRHRARISCSCLVGKAFGIKNNTKQID